MSGADILTPAQERQAVLMAFHSVDFQRLHARLQDLIDAKGLNRNDLAAIRADAECAPIVREVEQYLRFYNQQVLKRAQRRVGMARRKRH